MSLKEEPHASVIQAIGQIIFFLVFTLVQCVICTVKSLIPLSFRARKNIEGEVALITGAGSGIGRLTALRLARLKARVVVWDVNEAGVQETIKLIKAAGGDVKGYKVDLCNKEDVYKIAKQTIEEVGDVDILINNAGVVSGKNFLDTPDHLIQRTFDVNILAHFWTTKSFLPTMMKKNHGHIVTIASMAGYVGSAKLVDYCASKHAAVGFDESLKLELETAGYNGINTSCICPYFIQSTGMFDNVNARLVPRLNSNQVADEVVNAILYNRHTVLIPGFFAFGLLLKDILPWSVYSYFIRAVVLDAVPEHNSNKPDMKSFNDSVIKDTNNVKINAATDVTIKKRLTTAGEERQL